MLDVGSLQCLLDLSLLPGLKSRRHSEFSESLLQYFLCLALRLPSSCPMPLRHQQLGLALVGRGSLGLLSSPDSHKADHDHDHDGRSKKNVIYFSAGGVGDSIPDADTRRGQDDGGVAASLVHGPELHRHPVPRVVHRRQVGLDEQPHPGGRREGVALDDAPPQKSSIVRCLKGFRHEG